MIRKLLLIAVGLLYLLSIPWYRDPEAELRMLFGLPDWVAVALGCYTAAAVLNALAWLRTEVRDGDAADGPGDPSQGPPA